MVIFQLSQADSWPESDDLQALNDSPVSYLAAIGIGAGAPHPQSYRVAEELVMAHGTHRRIEAHHAVRFRNHMTDWPEWV